MSKVILTDNKYNDYYLNRVYFKEATEWAIKQCPSFLNVEVIDVSDVSGQWDQLAEFEFSDEKDVTMFLLRWA